jgi:hypothetical protein
MEVSYVRPDLDVNMELMGLHTSAACYMPIAWERISGEMPPTK